MSKKPSKGVIVRASIAHHVEQRQRALTASVEIRKLLAERADLLREVNTMRQKLNHRDGGAAPPRTLDRNEELSRQKDRQGIFDVETECFDNNECCNTTSRRLDSMQIRTFLEMQQQQQHQRSAVPDNIFDGAAAPLPPITDAFTSPTPSQVARFLDHVDSDLLHFLPS